MSGTIRSAVFSRNATVDVVVSSSAPISAIMTTKNDAPSAAPHRNVRRSIALSLPRNSTARTAKAIRNRTAIRLNIPMVCRRICENMYAVARATMTAASRSSACFLLMSACRFAMGCVLSGE